MVAMYLYFGILFSLGISQLNSLLEILSSFVYAEKLNFISAMAFLYTTLIYSSIALILEVLIVDCLQRQYVF